MVQPQYMIDTAKAAVPDAAVHPTDLNGGGDHWHMVVVAPSFDGLRPLARQRAILAAFSAAMASGAVHALDLKCITPDELQERFHGKLPAPFQPHQAGEGMHPNSW